MSKKNFAKISLTLHFKNWVRSITLSHPMWLPVIIMALIQEDCSFTYVEETIQQLKTENVSQNCKLIVSTFFSTN